MFITYPQDGKPSRMNLYRLAFKNISGNSFRSGVVALCALLVAAFALTTTLLMRGAESSLRLAIDRLGADIVVVPAGSEAKIESALLMGVPAKFWMPEDNVDKIAAIPGVEAVSPQLYLATLTGASCCSVPDMFMIAYDPETDFTIQPWLQKKIRYWFTPRRSRCRRPISLPLRVIKTSKSMDIWSPSRQIWSLPAPGWIKACSSPSILPTISPVSL